MARGQLDSFSPYSYRYDPAVPEFPDDTPLIVFDGICVLCNGFARFVAKRDPESRFRFTLRPGLAPGTIEETLGPVTATLRLVPDGTGVQQIPEGYRLLGVSLPGFLWPDLDVRESAEGGVYRFKVVMRLWGVLIQSYEGWPETTDGT